MTKIITLDIETAPNVAYVWGFWKQNIGLKQVKENGYIMSFAAKELGKDKILYEENRSNNDKKLCESLIGVLDDADIIVAHNGISFDLPIILGRAAVHGLRPPSPYKVIDTLKAARRYFRFPSNTLAYLAKVFGVEEKLEHKDFPGFELWLECLRKNPAAWEEMKIYNIQDVETLEQVYLKMRPYILDHPNIGVYQEDDVPVCPKCGSKHIHFRGYYNTTVGKYRRFQCNSCGGWGRTRYTEYDKDKRKVLLTNAI
jgi:hypothetical protein